LSARVESLESQLALVLAAVASAEVTSAARSDAMTAQNNAMEARILAALPAVLNAQHPARFPLHSSPVPPAAAGTSCPVPPSVVFSSGSDDSFSDEDSSDHADSLATIDPQSYVPASSPPGSPSYAALVFRIHQEYGAEGAVPATISHIAFALATEGVLLATIVGGIYSVRFRFTSKTNQTKARSLILTELFRGPGSPADCSATMMSALRDCWPSSFAQFPAMEAEQARLLDARWSEMGRAGTQVRHATWYADTRSRLQTFFFAARNLEGIVRSYAHADKSRHLSAFAFYKLFVLQQWNLMCTSGNVSATTAWPSLWASHFGHHLHAAPSATSMREQMQFLALSCSACAEIGYASTFCFSCKVGFPVAKVSTDQFQRKFDAWKAATSSTDKSAEAFRASPSYAKDKSSAAATPSPTAPELWFERLARDQSIVPAAVARIASV